MGRRHTFKHISPATSDQRASIGDRYVDEAITKINTTAAATVATMASYEHTVDYTLPMIFDDHILARAKAARGLIQPSSSQHHYQIAPNMKLGISFDDSLYPTIQSSAMRVRDEHAKPLLAFVETVRGIHMKFEEVKAVLRWMNRNATPGAIRYYWPTALKLCPTSPAFADLAGVPQRFTSPAGISDYLQSIKDCATTVAASALLPTNAKPRDRKSMWLTFSKVDVSVGPAHSNTKYATDEITYNI